MLEYFSKDEKEWITIILHVFSRSTQAVTLFHTEAMF